MADTNEETTPVSSPTQSVLIKCEQGNGQVALSDKILESGYTLARVYDIVDGFVTIEGTPEIVAHDTAEVLSMPGFSLASATEQEAATSTRRKTKSIKE